ncbi:hypothetical protein EGI15_05160 [Chryseobacterium cucumeris]|uniref:Phage tail lysozyme domain-containing protein n=2 Tax=Chryseobacterium cucumeris TaxID=1813611 RepID=A0ABX9XAE7_9FLAO|nr:hypothetical protein [Chryseobacterium cucumeris]ROH95251.1 hypothetical protein EGI15_05160 [Chryseobacterium cucumeris]
MTGTIIGNQNPLVGTTYTYEIKPSGLSFGLKGDYEWYLFKKQKNGSWKDITGKPKTGEKVTYNFGEIALGIEFQMKVYETKKGILPGLPSTRELAGSCVLIPTSNKVPKIDKVVLFNRGAKDVNKASYRDTLIAQAHCIAMFNKEIEFHLWEDDAPGKGHDASINKNNRHTRSYKARVNEKGIAEVSIPLMSDEKILRQMANQFLMKGDRNEGANHEYYVTATYSGQIQGASQVNVAVANPDYKGQPQNQPKPKPQPEKHTPKFPAGQGGGPKQPDPKGNIIEAVFIDDTGKELSKVAVGDKVRVRIHSKNMVEKHIQYVIWEYDTASNDEVFRSGNIKISADIHETSGFVITKDIFGKGIDSPIGDPDSDTQNYFIEIISKDLSAESQKFGVNPEGLMQVEKVKSAAGVQNTQKPDKPGSCICQEQYKDLVWGEKVNCEFRKKVVQICAELWGENRKLEMANGLMAVMNVETRGSFKAQQLEGWRSTKDPKDMTIKDFWKEGSRKSSRAIGLIQFTQDALQNNLKEYKSNPKLSVEERFDELNKLKLEYAQMGEIKQLDKVKKYFEPQKNSIKSPEDIYLSVFAPTGVGKSENYVLYQKYDTPSTNSEKNSTKNYKANESVDTGSKGNTKSDGKIQRSEILERYHDSIKQGKQFTVKTFSCSNNISSTEDKLTNEGYYIYLDGSIKYIECNDIINYYIQTKSGSNNFKKIATLNKNSYGMVQIPSSGKGFNRYGTEDKGGISGKEIVGKGDHYLLPSTAASLFGIIYEVGEKGWEIHLGDMSSENGSDPWQSGGHHHAGHGHMGNRKGLDLDFRYLNKNGISFQGLNTSSNFDEEKNETIYQLGHKYGFRKNYASGLIQYKKYGVNPSVGGHYDHGHLGLTNINLETVKSLNVKILN